MIRASILERSKHDIETISKINFAIVGGLEEKRGIFKFKRETTIYLRCLFGKGTSIRCFFFFLSVTILVVDEPSVTELVGKYSNFNVFSIFDVIDYSLANGVIGDYENRLVFYRWKRQGGTPL